MRYTRIALAVAALAASQQAAAVDIYVSGTTALRDVIPVILNDMCASAGREMYIAGTPIAGGSTAVPAGSALNAVVDKDRVAFLCTVNTSTAYGALSGQPLILHWSNEVGDSQNGTDGPLDRQLDGSLIGVATVAPSTTGTQARVSFVSVLKNGPNGCVADTVNNAISTLSNFFSGATLYDCPTESQALTQIGVSDVEPGKFANVYGNLQDATLLPNSGAPTITIGNEWSRFDTAKLSTVHPLFTEGFSVVVQNAVLNTSTGAAGAVAGGLTSLSLNQVAAILTGTVTNWNQLGYPTSAPIKVCTRAPGSGIKAAFSALTSKYGCYADANGNGGFELIPSFADTLSSNGTRYLDDGAGGLLRENTTASQVQSCMTDPYLADDITPNSTGALAIGIIDMNTMSTVDTTKGYRGIAINGVNPWVSTGGTTGFGGVAPGKSVSFINESLINPGAYPLWAEASMQISAVAGAIPSADATKVSAFFNLMINKAGATIYTNMFPGVMTIAGLGGAASGHTPTRGDMYYTRSGEICDPESYQ